MGQTRTTLLDDVARCLGKRDYGNLGAREQLALRQATSAAEHELYAIRPWPFLLRESVVSLSAYGSTGMAVAIKAILDGAWTDIDRNYGVVSFWWSGTISGNVHRRVPELTFARGAQRRLPNALATGPDAAPSEVFWLTYDAVTTQDGSAAQWADENAKVFVDPPFAKNTTTANDVMLHLHYYRVADMTAAGFDLPAKYHYALLAGTVAKAAVKLGPDYDLPLMRVWQAEWTRAKDQIKMEVEDTGVDYYLPMEARQGRWRHRE